MDHLKPVIQLMIETLDPEFILLFGSHAKGTARETSDYDIAYYSKRSIPPFEQLILKSQLSEMLTAEVDLINLKKTDTVFAAQIYYYGMCIYSKNEDLYMIEKMKSLSMYADFNEMKMRITKEIEDQR